MNQRSVDVVLATSVEMKERDDAVAGEARMLTVRSSQAADAGAFEAITVGLFLLLLLAALL